MIVNNVCTRVGRGGLACAQASLGGAPTRQSQVQAFLRVREKDAGPLDFDLPGGADTTWHRIYLCLRSGFHKEAVEVSCSFSPSVISGPMMSTTLLLCVTSSPQQQNLVLEQLHVHDRVSLPVQEAKGLRDAGLLRGGSFGAMLGEWVAGEGGLAPQSGQAMASEAERLLRSADRGAWLRSSFRYKAALYVLLSGDRRVAEHLLRVNPNTFLASTS